MPKVKTLKELTDKEVLQIFDRVTEAKLRQIVKERGLDVRSASIDLQTPEGKAKALSALEAVYGPDAVKPDGVYLSRGYCAERNINCRFFGFWKSKAGRYISKVHFWKRDTGWYEILSIETMIGYRRQGYARMVMKEFIRKFGDSRTTLCVRPFKDRGCACSQAEQNMIVVGFFRQFGFDLDCTYPEYARDGRDGGAMTRKPGNE